MKDINRIDFKKLGGLVPCVVQDAETAKVLMLGFMNQEALAKTLKEKKVTFYSRTKQKLWTKGETSGNFLEVVTVIPDCDADTLLIKVNPAGPVCHTGTDTCFNETNQGWDLHALSAIIENRKSNPSESSYTSRLFGAGINKIAQKVGEEAVEMIIEAKDDNKDLFLNESADLLFHYLVLLSAKGFSIDDVLNVLRRRHGK
jgi:phosphoribosyl-AMP cyclohydrolase / phosphoribosyl-ATP pyrophosphohydrolase